VTEARHSRRAAPALRALVETDPAVAALSLWCRHRDGAETGIAGEVVAYGPEVEALPAHEAQGLCARLVLHVALRHSMRMGGLRARLGEGFEADLWALAADALVNQVLLDADHAMPRPAVTLSDLLADLPEVARAGGVADWDVDRLYFAMTASGATRERARAHARRKDHRNVLRDASEGDPEPTEAEARWRSHLMRAMAAGRAAGRGLGRTGHRLLEMPAPRTPWEVVLRRLVTRAMLPIPAPHPTRPARRWLAGTAEAERTGAVPPAFEPGRRWREDVPRIAVGLDASSSIDEARLGLFWAEVTGIGRRMRAEIEVLVFDEAVRERLSYAPGRAPGRAPDLPRGGGTDLRAALNAARALRPSVIVMLTDGEGEAGPAPDVPVVWAVPRAARRMPFGRMLPLEG
jgi:predicted metal-dependent peptidase